MSKKKPEIPPDDDDGDDGDDGGGGGGGGGDDWPSLMITNVPQSLEDKVQPVGFRADPGQNQV